MIDLRSDAQAPPTEAMWDAMRSTPLASATYGEDPSVNALQERMADLLGKEAALWVPTREMANLTALLTIAPRGSSVVVEASSHVLRAEANAIEEVAGLAPTSLWGWNGQLEPGEVEDAMLETGARMLLLENTHAHAGGTVLSPELTSELAAVAHRHDVYVHLDGARLFNAAVSLGIPLADLARPVNTVTVSLDKGLCAPLGAILAGRAKVIELAHRTLRRLGGGSVHKAGIAAAAALVALETLVDGLADDHRRARDLGVRLAAIPGLRLEPDGVETNIVLVDVGETGLDAEEFVTALGEGGVLATQHDASRVRFVTHRLIGDSEVARVAGVAGTAVERFSAA